MFLILLLIYPASSELFRDLMGLLGLLIMIICVVAVAVSVVGVCMLSTILSKKFQHFRLKTTKFDYLSEIH